MLRRADRGTVTDVYKERRAFETQLLTSQHGVKSQEPYIFHIWLL